MSVNLMLAEGNMMFDFDKKIDRTPTYALKWDWVNPETELPMWVADMDFETAPAVKEAIVKRAMHGVFGYTVVPDEYKTAIVNWWDHRHHTVVAPESIVFSTGVVATCSSVIRELTNPGDKVVMLAPIYNCFYTSIKDNDRVVSESPLAYSGGIFTIDFEDLEARLADPLAKLLIFCNPHNPTGNVWSMEEMQRVAELCKKYGVLILSDEIHCEITKPGVRHTPFVLACPEYRDISITCASPSKAFNVAGLQSSYLFVDNQELRQQIQRRLEIDKVAEPNAFAIDSTIAAYEQGEEWLDALNAYIQENKELVSTFVDQHIPDLKVVPSDSTYLLWIDCTKVVEDTTELQRTIRSKTGLFITEGCFYGEAGRAFMRMNIATNRADVLDGCQRLKAGYEAYKEMKKAQ